MKTSQAEHTHFDLVVIGGGINGTGIARDAAGRGYSVCLVEQHDLAQATSSASTKLIHGGLRYLEHYAFRLVRESLQERTVLQSLAPHIIWPMRFILPHHTAARPYWLVRLGLFIYDHLGGRRSVPASGRINLETDKSGNLLKSDFTSGFTYFDCWVEDSRLVVLNAVDAARHGAEIRTGTKLVSASISGEDWQLVVRPESGPSELLSCSMLVNAAGPWAGDILHRAGIEKQKASLRLIKGSHLILNRQLPTQDAYLLQHADGRITFLIPYEERFTLLGTTDVDVHSAALSGQMDISQEETEYLLNLVNRYLEIPLGQSDIVASYAGVRPLFDDGQGKASTANRDYHLELSKQAGPPLLSVFGGKLTTYRRLAETALTEINNALGQSRPSWTASAPLPGGDFTSFDGLVDRLKAQIADIPEQLARRLVRAYGTEVFTLTKQASHFAELGALFGGGLSEAEVRYLIEHEFARTADDILYRRSKLYLHLTETEKKRFSDWWAEQFST